LKTLEHIVNGAASLPAEIASLKISGMTADSRNVKKGFLFAAIPGTVADGVKFIPQAVAAGASAVLLNESATVSDVGVPLIHVSDARSSLAKMAARFYGVQPANMAAVTGTAGKTSIASFMRQIWEHCGKRAAMIGTTGIFAPGRSDYGSLTTPDPVQLHEILAELAKGGVTHCSMEASSHGLDQHRLDGVELSVGGFINLGRDHMDYHHTVADYLGAKMRLFNDLLQPGQPAVIYADDEFSEQVIEVATKRLLDVKTVGRGGRFIALKRVEQRQFTQHAEVEIGGKFHHLVLPMAGEFQLANALVAAGMAIATGCGVDDVLEALANLKGAPGRLELVGQTENGSPAYVDYAHKPEALENVLAALRPYTTGKLVLVFGCGGDRDPGKRAIMGEIAERLANVVIVTDDNPRSEDAASIRSQVLSACPSAMEIGDRREAINYAVGSLGAGDCLVVAGKGHEEGQIVGDQTLPFSDYKVISEALEAAR